MFGLTSVGYYYAKPHYLIRSSSLPCCLNCALHRGKKEIDHEDREDNRDCFVLPFRAESNVSGKSPLLEVTHDRGLFPMENKKQAMTMEAKRY